MAETDILTSDEAECSNVMSIIDQRIEELWQQRWTASVKGRVTHLFMPTVGPANAMFDPPMKTSFLLTGHGSMNHYLHKHTGLSRQECMCGWEREDWAHILVDCAIYADLRDLHPSQHNSCFFG